MFYKTVIFLFLLSSIAFGAGMNLKKIKHLTLFRLLMFWAIIITAKFGELTAIKLIELNEYYILKNTAALITFFLGMSIIVRAHSYKANLLVIYNDIFFITFYIVINTFIITVSFAVFGVIIKHMSIITAIIEILFINFGIFTKIKIKQIYNYDFKSWYSLSGALIMFMVIIYFI